MSTQQVYFTGIARWAKVKTPDDYNGEKRWKIDIGLDDEGVALLKEVGLRNRPKKDDGLAWVVFRRETEKTFGDETVHFDPPKVTLADGTEFTGLIGNGSKVNVRVAVYDAGKMGKGGRLEAIQIVDLVEYEGGQPETKGVLPELPF